MTPHSSFSPSNLKLQGPSHTAVFSLEGTIVYSVCGPQAGLTACCSSSNRAISAAILARLFIGVLEADLASAAATVLTGCVGRLKQVYRGGLRCTSPEDLGMPGVMPSAQRHSHVQACMSVCFRSMLPDVVDDFRLANPYSKGHEAIFYSFYVFFTKFAAGISLGVSTLCLE